MPTEPGPDHFLTQPHPDPMQRLSDRGPRYQETPDNPAELPAGAIAEPFNTVTAALFIGIVAFWVIRLRGRFRQYPFVTSMLPILLAGGIGGTLYHAKRTQVAYFLLDVIPIQILGLGAAAYLVVRLACNQGWVKIGLTMIGVCCASLVLGTAFFFAIPGNNPNLRVNLSYLSLALIVVVPIAIFLGRTRFAEFGWIVAGLGCFGIAWFCRLVDNAGVVDLPMGTHWLWHIFGAACTMCLFEYFYRIQDVACSTTENR